MLVGVPKETKDHEYRVGVIPATVAELARRGHGVVVETGAGVGAGLADQAYEAAGAEITAKADEVFGRAELIVKVKEPLARSGRSSSAARFSSPTCISPPIARRLRISSHRVSRRSPMRR